jgi:hypothetical protein
VKYSKIDAVVPLEIQPLTPFVIVGSYFVVGYCFSIQATTCVRMVYSWLELMVDEGGGGVVGVLVGDDGDVGEVGVLLGVDVAPVGGAA